MTFTISTLSTVRPYAEGRIFYCYAECHYAECRYAECRHYFFIIKPSAITEWRSAECSYPESLVFTITLSVIILNTPLLSQYNADCHYKECNSSKCHYAVSLC
jgi:hypothetical protein